MANKKNKKSVVAISPTQYKASWYRKSKYGQTIPTEMPIYEPVKNEEYNSHRLVKTKFTENTQEAIQAHLQSTRYKHLITWHNGEMIYQGKERKDLGMQDISQLQGQTGAEQAKRVAKAKRVEKYLEKKHAKATAEAQLKKDNDQEKVQQEKTQEKGDKQ